MGFFLQLIGWAVALLCGFMSFGTYATAATSIHQIGALLFGIIAMIGLMIIGLGSLINRAPMKTPD